MKIIVGLGNPGKEHERTRHNVGFEVLDKLARDWGVSFRENKKVGGQISKSKEEEVWLLKPMLFMNRSGESVRKLIEFYKFNEVSVKHQMLDTIYLIHDDADLGLGRLKIQIGGGAGGHHGVENIKYQIPWDDVVRFRLGIGKPGIVENNELEIKNQGIDDWVLGKFSSDERKQVDEMVDKCVTAVKFALVNGVEKTMNGFN